MKRILMALIGGALIGAFAAGHAKLPAAPAKSDAEKKVEADKAAATKAKEAELLGKAQDKAVANYKKNQGVSMSPSKAPKK
jgi:gas vesicle protein